MHDSPSEYDLVCDRLLFLDLRTDVVLSFRMGGDIDTVFTLGVPLRLRLSLAGEEVRLSPNLAGGDEVRLNLPGEQVRGIHLIESGLIAVLLLLGIVSSDCVAIIFVFRSEGCRFDCMDLSDDVQTGSWLIEQNSESDKGLCGLGLVIK